MVLSRCTGALLACLLVSAGCKDRTTLFEKNSLQASGVRFNNALNENDSYGASFLSQSARFLAVDNNISSITITNSKGETRTIR